MQNAYRIVPVHTKDRQLLHGYEMAWCLLCRCGPAFRCQISSTYLHILADLVEWVAKQNYDVTFLMHYLDDFHTLGPLGSSVCQHSVDRSIDCFSKLGIPLHPDKLEGPSTCLTILGIELDSPTLKACLPQDKFDRTTALLKDWSQKRWCKCKELESPIGHLQHACKVVPQGHSFLRRIINLLCAFQRDDHPVHLNLEFFLDLAWWQMFFQSWNGCSFLQYPSVLHSPTSRFLQMPMGLLVTERSSRVTGFPLHFVVQREN